MAIINNFKIADIGIYNSQISRPVVDVSGNRKTAMFELELPIDNGGVSYIDLDASPITEDLFICAKPGQTRHTRFPFKCFYVHLYVSDKTLCETLAAAPNFIKISNRKKYLEIFEELYNCRNSDIKYSEILLESLLLKLIYTFCNDATLNDRGYNSVYNHIIKDTIEYIKNNIAEDLSLEKMAERISLSPIYFHNYFKYATGQTLHNYVEDMRIKKSVNLMLSTDMTLTEIAFACGFSSQSYYNYVFKRKMNITPRNYIKKLNENYQI